MAEISVAHGSFTVKRSYPYAPARVFAAFADARLKGKWFGDPEKESHADVFEFRVGGREHRAGDIPTGQTYDIEIRYYDIVENERIVYTYAMQIDDRRVSVSLATVEFVPDGNATRLTVTEHGAFLDGFEKPAERQGGTEFSLDRLADVLAGKL
jgi:uncharacterized protein YndB with AHSA1/START domain